MIASAASKQYLYFLEKIFNNGGDASEQGSYYRSLATSVYLYCCVNAIYIPINKSLYNTYSTNRCLRINCSSKL